MAEFFTVVFGGEPFYVKRDDDGAFVIPDEVRRWQQAGTALKPAWEPIVLAMKPLDGTFAANALAHGVAGLNVDGCRIAGEVPQTTQGSSSRIYSGGKGLAPNRLEPSQPHAAGRWPANVLLAHLPECREVGTREVRTGTAMMERGAGKPKPGIVYGDINEPGGNRGYADERGRETVAAWSCAEGCPVRMLDEQSGETGAFAPVRGTEASPPTKHAYGTYGRIGGGTFFADSGGASRFFYTAKADTGERSIGGIRCTHPTLKPIDLCAWLAKLILPPPRADGQPRRLLVPFSGAGSEIIGALRAGWDEVVGVEMVEEYVEQSRRRITGDAPLLNVAS